MFLSHQCFSFSLSPFHISLKINENMYFFLILKYQQGDTIVNVFLAHEICPVGALGVTVIIQGSQLLWRFHLNINSPTHRVGEKKKHCLHSRLWVGCLRYSTGPCQTSAGGAVKTSPWGGKSGL